MKDITHIFREFNSKSAHTIFLSFVKSKLKCTAKKEFEFLSFLPFFVKSKWKDFWMIEKVVFPWIQYYFHITFFSWNENETWNCVILISQSFGISWNQLFQLSILYCRLISRIFLVKPSENYFFPVHSTLRFFVEFM